MSTNFKCYLQAHYKDREEFMHVLNAAINAPMFDDDVSPWRVLIIPKDDNSESFIFLRCHHSLTDGGALFMVILPSIADRVKGIVNV
jgi:hypothetical protein